MAHTNDTVVPIKLGKNTIILYFEHAFYAFIFNLHSFFALKQVKLLLNWYDDDIAVLRRHNSSKANAMYQTLQAL